MSMQTEVITENIFKNLSNEDVRSILWKLIEEQGYLIFEDRTPDYTDFFLEKTS